MKPVFRQIPIEWLSPGRYQPRAQFPLEDLQQLGQSIVSHGVIEPLIVREIANQYYELIAGERRWRAAMLVGVSELPCLIGNYTDKQAAAVGLIENIQRQNLNLIEEANGYRCLLEEFHFQQEEIAILIGKSRSHVANILRILTLCSTVQSQVAEGSLSLGHAKMLVGLAHGQQIVLAEEIVKKNLSVRQLEQRVKALKLKQLNIQAYTDRDIQHLENQIAEQVGAPVKIISSAENGGWLQVKFFDNETLAGLLERMGLRYD